MNWLVKWTVIVLLVFTICLSLQNIIFAEEESVPEIPVYDFSVHGLFLEDISLSVREIKDFLEAQQEEELSIKNVTHTTNGKFVVIYEITLGQVLVIFLLGLLITLVLFTWLIPRLWVRS